MNMVHQIPQPGRIIAAIVVMTLLAPAGIAGEIPHKNSTPNSPGGSGSEPVPGLLPGQTEKKDWTLIPINDANIRLAPYVWKRFGAGRTARAEATMPGAYFKAIFRGSPAIRLLIDGAANNGCPPAAMPVVDYSLDHGGFRTIQLTKTGEIYALPLGEGLDSGAEHRLEVYFRAAGLGPNRWQAPTVHLRIAGIDLEAGGTLLPCPVRTKRAIGFGDSITEGVCIEGLCPYYSNLMMNNARATWFPLVCTALDCEYGQLGTGGQGMVKPLEIPPLPQTWDRYDATTSRLTDGLLTPEPDYIFCALGTNDYQGDADHFTLPPIAEEYTRWLAAVRQAAPHAMIFCIVPPLGWHAGEIAAAVDARNQSGDREVFLVDTAPLKAGFRVKGATQLAADGVHPSVYGNALLSALIAVEVQKILSSHDPP
jgi:hypothetical protein